MKDKKSLKSTYDAVKGFAREVWNEPVSTVVSLTCTFVPAAKFIYDGVKPLLFILY